jgi:hypothetical protein
MALVTRSLFEHGLRGQRCNHFTDPLAHAGLGYAGLDTRLVQRYMHGRIRVVKVEEQGIGDRIRGTTPETSISTHSISALRTKDTKYISDRAIDATLEDCMLDETLRGIQESKGKHISHGEFDHPTRSLLKPIFEITGHIQLRRTLAAVAASFVYSRIGDADW